VRLLNHPVDPAVTLTLQMPGHMIGAAFAASAPAVPAWKAGLGPDKDNIGGLVGTVLSSAGVFGRILTVLTALTVPSAVSPSMYSYGTSLMSISPFFAKVPRYIYAFIATAMYVASSSKIKSSDKV